MLCEASAPGIVWGCSSRCNVWLQRLVLWGCSTWCSLRLSHLELHAPAVVSLYHLMSCEAAASGFACGCSVWCHVGL